MRCLEGRRLLSDGRIRYLFESTVVILFYLVTRRQPANLVHRHTDPGQQQQKQL